MPGKRTPSVLILGGAGFIGSNLAIKFCEESCPVTIIDGLLPHTGGRIENLRPILSEINFFQSNISRFQDLRSLIQDNDVIIDCMAWTSHILAKKDPFYDLKLNVESHLYLIKELINFPSKQVIYLGSRVQYGNPKGATISEQTVMIPEDVQGIHKLASESYFRIFCGLHKLNVVSLRLSNCYGPNQPVEGEDLGLVGNFINDLLRGRTVILYEGSRPRNLLYVKDLADTVFNLAGEKFREFQPFNYGGPRIKIEKLVKELIGIIGQGGVRSNSMPAELKAADMGKAVFSNSKLEKYLGRIQETDVTTGLKETVRYFQRMKDDSALRSRSAI